MSSPERIPTVDPDRPRRRMGIKNLTPGLVERGKIKIGQKGAMRTSGQGNQFQPPQKLDHFLITTMERGQDGNFLRDEAIHRQLGDKPREIPVVLIYDDIDLNFQTRYAAYKGRSLWCSGDGEVARRMIQPGDPRNGKAPEFKEGACPCHRQDPTYTGPDKCKINGTLSVMIRGAEAIGGVWKLRTTSYNTVVGILSSLALIKRITGGPLAGIPLTLTLTPKAVADPIRGSQQTVYVVGIEYRGAMEALQNTGHELMLSRATHNLRIEHIEDEARQLISHSPANYAAPDSVDDEVEEFYPEAVQGEVVQANADGFTTEPPIAANDNRQQGGGADALNAAAQAAPAPKAESVAEAAEKPDEPAGDTTRVAGRLTYWINEETGEYREIQKGEVIPTKGRPLARRTMKPLSARARFPTIKSIRQHRNRTAIRGKAPALLKCFNRSKERNCGMDAANDNDVYLTPAELSARFKGRISVRTLANWRCLGHGPRYTKVGGSILYPLAEVEAWEASRTVNSTSGYKRAC